MSDREPLDDPTHDREPVEAFADRLRQLHEASGHPSYVALERLMREDDPAFQYRRATIFDVLQARQAPDWKFVVAFVRATGRYAGESHDSDLPRWFDMYLRMLDLVDQASAAADSSASAPAHGVDVRPPGSDVIDPTKDPQRDPLDHEPTRSSAAPTESRWRTLLERLLGLPLTTAAAITVAADRFDDRMTALLAALGDPTEGKNT